MNRRFRLTKSTDFKRVRREGRSFAHPLLVLIADPNRSDETRIGVVAGKRIGNAVQRNKAKRRLREAARALHTNLQSGWDLVLLARPGMLEAHWDEIVEAVRSLAADAQLLKKDEDDGTS
jgi:ribonuclease P protein component